jgi:hypothetical protein
VKPLHRYIFSILLLNILVIATGYFLSSGTDLNIIVGDIVLLSAFFSIIAITTIIIFLRGQTKEPDSQTLHSLVSVSLKFLLELALALLWFIVIKKTVLLSVIIFFVLYLTFTLFSVWIILKTLKNKSL